MIKSILKNNLINKRNIINEFKIIDKTNRNSNLKNNSNKFILPLSSINKQTNYKSFNISNSIINNNNYICNNFNNFNNNNNGLIINKNQFTSNVPPPLIKTQLVKRTKKELISMYILIFVSCSIICVIYYIAYLYYQRLQQLNKGLEEIENLTDDEIREIIAESKRKRSENEKQQENKKIVPIDRVLK